jgi:uncharacterized protein (TIGR03084 family)
VPTDRNVHLKGLIGDLVDEVAALDTLISTLTPEQWSTTTPAEGWDIRDSIAHLAVGDEMALECVTTRQVPKGMQQGLEALLQGEEAAIAFERSLTSRGRQMKPDAVYRWWKDGNAALCDALQGVDAGDKLPWGPNRMSPASFTTARIMEAWAHGLDCFDAMNATPVDTGRLFHIAHLSQRSLPYAFMAKGAQGPGAVRLELTSPSGEAWNIGPDDAPTVITGTASDWCRVATHRDRRDERSRITATGPDADDVMQHVQAYL